MISELQPSDFGELKELLDFMREMGRDKVQVMKLTLNFRNVLYKLGYSDKDIISIQEIEKYLDEALDEDTSINQFIKLHQEVKGTSESTSSIHQTSSTTDEDSDAKIISEISPWLEAIGKNRTKKLCFVFKPFKNFVLKLFVFQELLNKGIHNVLESNVPLKFSTPLPLEFYQLFLVFRSNSHKFSPRHLLHQTNAYRLLNINVCLTAKRPKSLNLNLLNNLTVKQFNRWWA